MANNELVVVTNEFSLPSIQWNKDEVNGKVSELTKKFDGLVFDQEQLPSAKKDLAGLRKVKTNLNNEKKKVKTEWNANYTIFENEIKESMGEVDTLIASIDLQVKEFETKLKEDRIAVIKSLKEWKVVEDYVDFNEDWTKKKFATKDDKTLKELFVTYLEQITSWKSTITMMANSHKLIAADYVELLKTKSYEEVSKKIVADAELLKKHEDNNEPVIEVPGIVAEIPKVFIAEDATVLTAPRNLIGTMEQLKALKDYAIKIGVKIERIPND